MQANNTHFVVGESGLASFVSAWLPVGAAGMRDASITVTWAAAASTDGAVTLEGTDDPSGTVFAELTVDKQHGDDIAAVAATAGTAVVILANCPGFVRMRYTRTAGGAAAQFDAYVTVHE